MEYEQIEPLSICRARYIHERIVRICLVRDTARDGVHVWRAGRASDKREGGREAHRCVCVCVYKDVSKR